MSVIKVRVKGEIATNITPETKLVCKNDGYKVEFEFDETWGSSKFKTALFISKDGMQAVPFDGNVCAIPAMYGIQLLRIGVRSSDVEGLHTSTAASVPYLLSAEDLTDFEIEPPTKSEYDTIIAMLNEYIEIGAMTRDELIVLIDEQTADLQEASSEELATIAKTIVGAINETLGISNSGKTTAETALSNAEKAQKTADNAQGTASAVVGIAQTAYETAESAKEIAERAEKTVDLVDDTAAQALNVSAQALSIASRLDITAIESKVEKTNEPNQLYGTDENGNPALYPTDSVGTQVLVDGQKVKEFKADEKFDKTGGVIDGEVTIEGDLIVKGTTKTVDTETLSVKDNIIVANVDNAPLAGVSGFAVKTGEVDEETQKQLAYGIMYDKQGDGVKIGLGGFDENGDFVYNEGQAQFLATRADNITDGNLPQWDNDKKQFVDSGKKIGDYVKFTDYATASKAGVVKNHYNQWASGIEFLSDGSIRVKKADNSDINVKISETMPIVPKTLDYATMSSLADCKDTTLWTEERKTKACETIGAVTRTEFNENKGTKLYLHRISHSGGDDILIVNRYSMEYTSTEEIVANVFEGSSEEHLPINSYYMNGGDRVNIIKVTSGIPSTIVWIDVNSLNFATADFGDLSSDTVTEL